MTQLNWTEGKWNGDCPEIPDRSFMWITVDRSFGPLPKHYDSVDYYLLSCDATYQERGEGKGHIRWWWAPIERPDNLPAEYRKRDWTQCWIG